MEGWLTKSPPEKHKFKQGPLKLLQAKWRRRYFVLDTPRTAQRVPGSFLLSYFNDESKKKLLGTIDLDLCDEVTDKLESGHYRYLFSLKTKHKGKDRVYYLAADNESQMINWVDSLCRVCDLKPNVDRTTIDVDEAESESSWPQEPAPAVPWSNLRNLMRTNNQYVSEPSGVGVWPAATSAAMRRGSGEPYIPLSECESGGAADDQPPPLPAPRRDSIPKEMAPLPPVLPNKDGSRYTTFHDLERNSEDFYKLPPLRYHSAVDPPVLPPSTSAATSSLGDKPAESLYKSPRSVYDVPRSAAAPSRDSPRNSNSSAGSRCSQKGQDSAYESGEMYDVPASRVKPLPVEMLHERMGAMSLADSYDVPPGRPSGRSLLQQVPPPPGGVTSHPVAPPVELRYQNLDDASSHNNLPPSVECHYDFPRKDLELLTKTPPIPTHHDYVNSNATGDFYMPMGGDTRSSVMASVVPPAAADGASVAAAMYTPMDHPPPPPRPDDSREFPVLSRGGSRSFKRHIEGYSPSLISKYSNTCDVRPKPIGLPLPRQGYSSSDDESTDSRGLELEAPPASSQPAAPSPKPAKHNKDPRKSLSSMPPAPRFVNEIQYVRLDLDSDVQASNHNVQPASQSKGNLTPVDYKEIDFIKTNALSETRKDREREEKTRKQ